MKQSIRILKKSLAAWAAVIVASFFNQAFAQVRAPESFQNKSTTDLLHEYQNLHAGSPGGEGFLIDILNKGLPLNDDNLKAVRSILAKARAQDDKILLVKVMASMYTPRVRSQQNLSIENDIKGLINSADLRVAREAVIEYSRLGYPPDRYQVLQRAHAAKVIGDNAYYGELAHGLRLSTPTDQPQMLTELEEAQNQSANEILATTFGNPQLLGQLNRSAQVRLLNLLSDHEPVFPMALDSFGLIDAIRYTFWINAVATIDSTLNGTPYAQLVVARLSPRRTDPRKILAVFSSPEGKRVIKETSDGEKLHALLLRAEAYSNSLPQNDMMKSAAALFSSRLNAGGGPTSER